MTLQFFITFKSFWRQKQFEMKIKMSYSCSSVINCFGIQILKQKQEYDTLILHFAKMKIKCHTLGL